eukprot:COSAG06_NODE_1073_length_10819_cov_4.311847_11_plen_66_part_00
MLTTSSTSAQLRNIPTTIIELSTDSSALPLPIWQPERIPSYTMDWCTNRGATNGSKMGQERAKNG